MEEGFCFKMVATYHHYLVVWQLRYCALTAQVRYLVREHHFNVRTLCFFCLRSVDLNWVIQ